MHACTRQANRPDHDQEDPDPKGEDLCDAERLAYGSSLFGDNCTVVVAYVVDADDVAWDDDAEAFKEPVPGGAAFNAGAS